MRYLKWERYKGTDTKSDEFFLSVWLVYLRSQRRNHGPTASSVWLRREFRTFLLLNFSLETFELRDSFSLWINIFIALDG